MKPDRNIPHSTSGQYLRTSQASNIADTQVGLSVPPPGDRAVGEVGSILETQQPLPIKLEGPPFHHLGETPDDKALHPTPLGDPTAGAESQPTWRVTLLGG